MKMLQTPHSSLLLTALFCGIALSAVQYAKPAPQTAAQSQRCLRYISWIRQAVHKKEPLRMTTAALAISR
jgi:hypothetical protein